MIWAINACSRALLRRACFDLTGLPPTPEECDAFLADNPDFEPFLNAAEYARAHNDWLRDCWLDADPIRNYDFS